MRAAWVERFGPPEVVKIVDRPEPVPDPGQVRVDIHAASINYPDLLHIADRYQGTLAVPFIPGGEFAGVVSGVGPSAEGFAIGDRVRGSQPTGAYAEAIAIGTDRLMKLPPDADLVNAAAFFCDKPHGLSLAP